MTLNNRRLCLLFLVATTLAACQRSPATIGTGDAKETTAARSLRIVTLSPHLAELVFSIGAGAQLVGVSAYTDYPQEVRDLPIVGDAFALDLEQLALLQPDILLAWQSGTPTHVIDELRGLDYRVELVHTATLADIGPAMQEIGAWTGHVADAGRVANEFLSGVNRLESEYAGKESIRVFYQVAKRPLYTVNGEHYISDVVKLCGGRNVFSDLDALAPLIAVEAVLERDPEVLLASTDAGENAFTVWDRWSGLAANRFGNRFLMPADEIGRATPRLLVAARTMCEALETGRANRASAGA